MQEHTGFNRCLLHLLVVWALTQQCKALSSAPKQVQLPTLDPAKQYAADFRMQATSYAAYMMVRDYQTSDAFHCNYPGRAADVCKWSSKDPGWERLVRAESMVAIAHQAYQAAEYDEAIIALEESLALRLFAYTDQKTLDRWQQGLVMPGTQYRHDKKAIADSLVLRSDCLVQLARANQDVAELTEATELLQLAAAELQAGQALTAASLAAISTRMNGIAVLAADLLPQLSHTRLQDLLGQHGISCSASTSGSGSNATTVQPPEWCDSPGELLLHLVPLLRLPVCLLDPRGKALTSSLGCGSTQQQQQGASLQQQQKLRKGQVPKVEPASDPFATFGTALLQKPCEVVAHYLQRMFFRLLSVVPVEYMRDLRVPCQRTDLRSRCISYLPTWVTAQAVTIDKRTGRAHVTGPSSCALDGSGWGVADPAACVAAQRAQQGSASTCQVQQQQQKQAGGLELCGFLHIRNLAPGRQLPLAGAQLSREQQALLRQASDAVHPGRSCSASGTGGSRPGCAGGARVFYYYYPDIPAVLDQVIHAQEHEESMQLLAQLDSLTNTHSLKRWLQKRNKAGDCSEAALLEGRAPDTCSVLVPSIGDCSGSHLTAPPPGTPLPLLPSTQLPQARMHVLSAAAAAAAPSPACGSEGGGSSSSTCKGADSAGDDSSSSRQRAQRHRGDAHDGAEDDGGGGGGGGGDIVTSSSGSSRRNSNGSKRRRSKQSSDPYLDTPPYPHMYSSYARVDREIADRQLLEQMNKLERDKRHKQQDGPLIPLTLGMLVLICCLPFIASRLRRASSRQQQQQQQQVGVLGFLLPPLTRKGSAAVAPGRPAVPVPATGAGANGGAFGVPGACPAGAAGVWAPSASAAAPAAGLVPDASGSAGGRVDSSAVQRSAAAAVKAALSSSSDLEAMETALRQAEKAGMANTANCVRLRELLAKRKRQAQQAKRQEQMRQQEQARRGRKGRKGQQESLADAAAPGAAQQAAGSAQQEQPGKAGVRRPLFRAPAWLRQVLPALGKKGKQAADGGDASSRGLGRVSDSSSTAAAAAAASAGISRSCSISSSRSASSSMISSSPSLGLAPLADLNTNASSSGCSPATSVSCSPQSSIRATPAVQQQERHPSDTPTQQQQQPQQRERSNRRSGRGSVTVAVAPRSSKQQQQASVDADEADLADSLLADVQDTTGHSSASSGGSSSAASSPQAAAGGGCAKKQQHKVAGREPVCSDLSSPTGTGAAGNLPIYTPPKRNSTSPAGSKASAGGAKGAAGAGKGAKGKQQPQAVSLSAAALGCESGELFGQGTPGSVITASVGLDSSARSGSGTFGAAAVGVEPPATPAGAAAALPLRSERHHHQRQQQLPPPWQQQQQQQHQQRPAGRTSMSWLEAALPPKHRAAAVSEDGTLSNSSSCLNSPAGAQQLQQGTPPGAAGGASTQSTPSKAKLNPKAAPYNPKGYTPSPGSAAAAAAGGDWHSPAPNHTPGLILTPSPPGTGVAAASTGSSNWQQHGNPAAAAAAAGVASMLQQQEGTGVARRVSCNGLLEPSAVSGLSGMSGLPPPGNLAGGISAAAGLQAAHNMQQMLLQQQHYGMLPPHSAGSLQQQQAAAAAWQQQQQQQLQEMQREEHLVAMLSALSPQDAAAAVAAMGLGGASGSAPPPLGTAGSSGSSGVTGGGVPIDSSASSSGEYRGHILGLGAPHGLGWSEGAGLGRPPLRAGPHAVPPGFPGSLSWQQQQQQFQMPGRISLPQDLDSQLPPGFSAETFTPGSDTAAGPYSATSSVGGVPGSAFSSPASAAATPTGSSAMLGGNSGSNPWRYVPVQGKPATPLLIVSEAAVAGPLAMQGYGGSSHGGGQPLSMSMGMSMGMDVCHAQSAMDHSLSAAAAATSANVAELVLLGSSPPQNPVAKALEGVEELFYGGGGRGGRGAAGGSGSTAAVGGGSGSSVASGMTAADADAHAARLADEMTAGVLD